MNSKQILKAGRIIGLIVIVVGLIMLLANKDRLSAATAFGGDASSYLRGTNYTMRSTYALIGTDSIVEDGNIAFAGLIIMIAGGAIFLVSYLISNNRKLVENSESQVELLRNMKEQEPLPDQPNEKVDIAGKLKQLDSLYEQRIITKEEYETKRKDILDKM